MHFQLQPGPHTNENSSLFFCKVRFPEAAANIVSSPSNHFHHLPKNTVFACKQWTSPTPPWLPRQTTCIIQRRTFCYFASYSPENIGSLEKHKTQTKNRNGFPAADKNSWSWLSVFCFKKSSERKNRWKETRSDLRFNLMHPACEIWALKCRCKLELVKRSCPPGSIKFWASDTCNTDASKRFKFASIVPSASYLIVLTIMFRCFNSSYFKL